MYYNYKPINIYIMIYIPYIIFGSLVVSFLITIILLAINFIKK